MFALALIMTLVGTGFYIVARNLLLRDQDHQLLLAAEQAGSSVLTDVRDGGDNGGDGDGGDNGDNGGDGGDGDGGDNGDNGDNGGDGDGGDNGDDDGDDDNRAGGDTDNDRGRPSRDRNDRRKAADAPDNHANGNNGDGGDRERLTLSFVWTYIETQDGWFTSTAPAWLRSFPHRPDLERALRSREGFHTTITERGEIIRLYTLPVVDRGRVVALVQTGKPISWKTSVNS